jgi:hypothetical protein
VADLSPVSESDDIYVPKKSGGSENNAAASGQQDSGAETGTMKAKDASAS